MQAVCLLSILMDPVPQIKLHTKHIYLQKLNSEDIVAHAIQHLTAQGSWVSLVMSKTLPHIQQTM